MTGRGRRTYTQTYDAPEEAMVGAAQTICFGDYTNERLEMIIADGHPVHYTGWQPDMVFTFADEDDNEVYTFAAPQWEH